MTKIIMIFIILFYCDTNTPFYLWNVLDQTIPLQLKQCTSIMLYAGKKDHDNDQLFMVAVVLN